MVAVKAVVMSNVVSFRKFIIRPENKVSHARKGRSKANWQAFPEPVGRPTLKPDAVWMRVKWGALAKIMVRRGTNRALTFFHISAIIEI